MRGNGGRPRWANDEVWGLVVDEGQKGTIRGSNVVQDGGLQVTLPVRGVAREVQAQAARAERNASGDDTRGAIEVLQYFTVGAGTKFQL